MKRSDDGLSPGLVEGLAVDLHNLGMSAAMQTTAISLLRNIEGACTAADLDRTVTFANGYTLGLDRDHVSEQTVLGLQGIYLQAYETRRNHLITA